MCGCHSGARTAPPRVAPRTLRLWADTGFGSLVLLDYEGAFDGSSHIQVDRALGRAGASAHSRAIFRAIYFAATGVVRSRKASGEAVFSEPFDIGRGNIQGDIFSPWGFNTVNAVICYDADGGVADLDLSIRLQCLRIERMEREWNDEVSDAIAWNVAPYTPVDLRVVLRSSKF
eukprot:SAG31_NODE_6929_length_1846_cov_17.096165_1_plen_174_part_00